MNRKERRKAAKKLIWGGKSSLSIGKLSKYLLEMIQQKCEKYKDGDKVLLDVARIKSQVDYPRKVQAYRDFVEANKDKPLTVLRDKESKFYMVQEDTSEIKWLFADADLIEYREGK